MEFNLITIAVLICCTGVLLYAIRRPGSKDEKYQELLKEQQQLGQIKDAVNEQLHHFETKIGQRIQSELKGMGEQIQGNLDKGTNGTQGVFQKVIERLARIDEAQKNIEGLSKQVVSLQDILSDKKARGIFGETQLNNLLGSVFSKNTSVFQTQWSLPSKAIADAALFLPPPTGTICIDSKFPLENYRRANDSGLSDRERADANKKFKQDLKTHIDAISSKYILPPHTANQAIMFLPAEAIFSEMHNRHQDIVTYAQQKRVWPTSPSTLLAVLSTVQTVMQNIERDKYTQQIHEELEKLSKDFERFRKRWDQLAKHIETVSKDVRDVHISSEKISDRFQKIQEVDLPMGSITSVHTDRSEDEPSQGPLV